MLEALDGQDYVLERWMRPQIDKISVLEGSRRRWIDKNSALEGSRRRWVVKKVLWRVPEGVGSTKKGSQRAPGGFWIEKSSVPNASRKAQDAPGCFGRAQTLRL